MHRQDFADQTESRQHHDVDRRVGIEPEQVLIDNHIAPWPGLKKPVWATMSKARRIKVPARTGVDSTTRMLVPSIAQQYIGNCMSVSPGRRSFRIVAMKLMPPRIELPPRRITLKIQTSCPAAGVVRLKGDRPSSRTGRPRR